MAVASRRAVGLVRRQPEPQHGQPGPRLERLGRAEIVGGQRVAGLDELGQLSLERGPRAAGSLGTAEGPGGIGRQFDQRRRVGVLDQAGQRAVAGLRALENARQGVIVALRDRVELVIVAAGTGDGQAEKCLAGDVDLFIGQVQQELRAVLHVVSLAADRQEAGGDQLLGPFAVVPGGQAGRRRSAP